MNDAINVTVVFTNGNVVSFYAQEFNANLFPNPNRVNQYPYKNNQGEDSFVYLQPNEVAGIFLTKPTPRGEQTISYTVAHAGRASKD